MKDIERELKSPSSEHSPVSEHEVFAFYLVAYGRFDCTMNTLKTDTALKLGLYN